MGIPKRIGTSEPAQSEASEGSERGGPPHLHFCRPKGLMAESAGEQTRGPPCLRGSFGNPLDPGSAPRRRAGPGRGRGGACEAYPYPTLPGTFSPRNQRGLGGRCGSLPPGRRSLGGRKKKKRLPSNEKKQPEPAAPARRESRGEAVSPTRSPTETSPFTFVSRIPSASPTHPGDPGADWEPRQPITGPRRPDHTIRPPSPACFRVSPLSQPLDEDLISCFLCKGRGRSWASLNPPVSQPGPLFSPGYSLHFQ